jgi:hypothetical protein
MKNVVVLVIVAAVLFFGGRWAWQKLGGATGGDAAERRVSIVLTSMQAGGDEQAGASMYAEGVQAIADEAGLSRAYDRWMRWRQAQGLEGPIGTFSVDAVDATATPPVVTVTIDGRRFRIAVPPKNEMAWAS